MQRKKYSQKAGRVVKKAMADGSIREYRYAAWAPDRPARHAADTVGALSIEWRASPEWAAYRPVTRDTYTIYLKELEALAALPVADVARRDIMALRDAIATTRGNGAAMSFIAMTGAAFTWALNRGWIAVTPCHKIPALPLGTYPTWTEEQLAYALPRLPEHLRRVVVLAVHTAQRRGDLCAMTWSAYDGHVIRLTQQKTGVALTIPVHPDLRRELAIWRNSATATQALTTDRGVPWVPANLTKTMAYALAGLGLPGLNVHGLRKLAAVRLAEAGCSAHEIASVTGHRTLAMVQQYTRSVDQGRLAQAAIVRLRGKETG